MSRKRLLPILAAVVLILAATALAAYAAITATVSGPTIDNKQATTWRLTWQVNVTAMSNPDKHICLATTPQGGTTTITPCARPAPNADIGIWTCQVTVTNQAPVAWSIAGYTSQNDCGGSPSSVVGAGRVSPLAVKLANFTAARSGATVRVMWETISETDNAGFKVYRSATETSERALLAFIPARAVGATSGAAYEYSDRTAIDPRAVYWLEDIDLSGKATLHGPLTPEAGSPNAVTALNFSAAPITPNVPLYLAALLVMAGGLWFALYRVGRGRA